jgi:hypothetical protein
MAKLKRAKGEQLCGDEIVTTYGSIKLAQNQAFREGIAYVVQFLEGRDQPYTALVVKETIGDAALYETPRCACEQHYKMEAGGK